MSDFENEHDTTPSGLILADPILVLVTSTQFHIDACTSKWLLQSEGIPAFLGGRDVYVLEEDLPRARAILDRTPL